MNPLSPASWPRPLDYGLAAFALAAAVGATVIIIRHRRRLTPEQIECARRLQLHATGRMGSGEIVDTLAAPGAEGLAPLLVFQYEVRGVVYQASQALHLVPVAIDPAACVPGWPVQVKYDPAHPGNSIVVCEHWSGLPAAAKARAATTPAATGA